MNGNYADLCKLHSGSVHGTVRESQSDISDFRDPQPDPPFPVAFAGGLRRLNLHLDLNLKAHADQPL